MNMPNTNRPTITDFYDMSESQKMNILWMGVTEMWTKISEMETTTKSHDTILVTGGGEPSMLERMRNVEKFIDGAKYWLRFIGGALVVQTIAFIVAIIVGYIRFLPLLERLAAQP